MQDEVRDKSVALVIKVGKAGVRMTAGLLKWAMRQYLEQSRNPKIHHGRQTVRQLVRQNAGVQNIEVTDKNIKSFERIARKYGVDFALKKDPKNQQYLVFFKARDKDVLTAAFTEYTAKTVRREKEKPSIRRQLSKFKEMVKANMKDTVKRREKGEMSR